MFDAIANGKKKTRFKVTLVAVSGLPNSGKSTLFRKLVSQNIGISSHVLSMSEVGYCATSKSPQTLSPEWELFPREQIHMYMLTRALADKYKKIPMLAEWTHENNLPTKCLKSVHLRTHFKKVYNYMREGLLKVADNKSAFHLYVTSEPLYVFLNIWDIGFSKALHEALPLIARLMDPFLLLNVINFARDTGSNLRELPEKTYIHEAQKIMQGRSRGHYTVRITGLCKERTFLIGTHKDKVPKKEVPKTKRLAEAGLQAKGSDTGVGGSLHPEMLVVNLHEKNDTECIKRHIEEVISSTDKFDHDIKLSWMFLRTALIHFEPETKSDFRMPRREFDELAQECGLKTKEEIEKCLKFFTQIGSLLFHEKYFADNVIFHPHNFFKELNSLYEAVDSGDEHMRQSLKVGLLCKRVAKEVWKEDSEFFWKLMQQAGVATPTREQDTDIPYDYDLQCPYCEERDLLYVSTLRTERLFRKEGMKNDSLFITFNAEYVPADIQTHFVKQVKKYIPEIKLTLTAAVYYNSTEFEMPKGGKFQIIVHGDVVELITNVPRIKSTLRAVCVKILDSVLKYFPRFEYQLGLLCTACLELFDTDPPNNNTTTYLSILPSQYATELYCRRCNKMIALSDRQKKWMEVHSQVRSEGNSCVLVLCTSFPHINPELKCMIEQNTKYLMRSLETMLTKHTKCINTIHVVIILYL